MPEDIPTISLAPIVEGKRGAGDAVARVLDAALREWGAFQLVDHGVPAATAARAFAAAERFFALPLEERLTIRVDKTNRGYVPMRQTLYPGNLPDLKESFNFAAPLPEDDSDILAGTPLYGFNRWPALEGFRDDAEAYYAALTTLGDRLLGPLAICLDMSPQVLRAHYRKPIAFMRLFHYPPDGRLEDGEYGAAEHTDYGFLTILAQDASGGLEVRSPSGAMIAAPPRPDAFIVNAGDMLADVSGGRFRSAPHRVINRAGRARYSIPFFYDPDFDARFETLPGVSAGEFMLKKFNKFYKHRQEPAPATL